MQKYKLYSLFIGVFLSSCFSTKEKEASQPIEIPIMNTEKRRVFFSNGSIEFTKITWANNKKAYYIENLFINKNSMKIVIPVKSIDIDSWQKLSEKILSYKDRVIISKTNKYKEIREKIVAKELPASWKGVCSDKELEGIAYFSKELPKLLHLVCISYSI